MVNIVISDFILKLVKTHSNNVTDKTNFYLDSVSLVTIIKIITTQSNYNNTLIN